MGSPPTPASKLAAVRPRSTCLQYMPYSESTASAHCLRAITSRSSTPSTSSPSKSHNLLILVEYSLDYHRKRSWTPIHAIFASNIAKECIVRDERLSFSTLSFLASEPSFFCSPSLLY